MKIFFIIFSLFNCAFAEEIWTRDTTIYLMDKYEDTQMSKNCIDRKESCHAFYHYKNRLEKRPTAAELVGGKNPGAVICTKYLKSGILILKNRQHQENAFCRFTDGSLLSASSL